MTERICCLKKRERFGRVRSGRWKSISRYGLYVPLPLPERFARPTRIAVEALETGVQRSFRIAAVAAGSFLAACDGSGSVPAAIIGADQRKVHLETAAWFRRPCSEGLRSSDRRYGGRSHPPRRAGRRRSRP